ncbi:amidohydrolase family protein, partial [Aerococcus loyolae]
EYTAGVVAARPDRFGFFATLTLPDVDGALEEAAYAFDVLKADGVILLANSRGAYLGETKFHPLLEELNRRKAVALIHPNEFPGSGALGFPASMTDFLLDTTRAALSLVSSGAMERFSDLKIILSHAGGFLPYASYRFAPFLGFLHEGGPISEDAALGLMRKFYFDTALSSSPAAMPSLLAFADPTRILFGSDWPFAPVPVARAFAGKLDAYPLDADLRRDIDRRNALALFPRLAD